MPGGSSDGGGLKYPLQALLIAPDHGARVAILYGDKLITIREGWRDYRPGPVMLCCHVVPWAVLAEITSVRHCILREVTEEEWKNDGFFSQDGLLRGLQRFYSHMTLDSPVTVIRWQNAQGFLVEHVSEYDLAPDRLYGKIDHGERHFFGRGRK